MSGDSGGVSILRNDTSENISNAWFEKVGTGEHREEKTGSAVGCRPLESTNNEV